MKGCLKKTDFDKIHCIILDSSSQLPCIPFRNTRRVSHHIHSHLGLALHTPFINFSDDAPKPCFYFKLLKVPGFVFYLPVFSGLCFFSSCFLLTFLYKCFIMHLLFLFKVFPGQLYTYSILFPSTKPFNLSDIFFEAHVPTLKNYYLSVLKLSFIKLARVNEYFI